MTTINGDYGVNKTETNCTTYWVAEMLCLLSSSYFYEIVCDKVKKLITRTGTYFTVSCSFW